MIWPGNFLDGAFASAATALYLQFFKGDQSIDVLGTFRNKNRKQKSYK